ncbi:MAG: hypothetical protein F4W96_03035 [Chloroflexi bacterium]|nr:hypothetical protein [Chloroflexota bacterium]
MDLSEWEETLREHFAQLSGRRSTERSGAPVFALEHGLSAQQVEELQAAVRDHVSKLPPSSQHRLVWVIYATESGYAYSGDEYWQSFEEETPGWVVRGRRNWLRSCFRYFAQTFAGATPSGPWARQFSIIAWPITHAILPKDLQRHLAHTLYDIRYAIQQEHLDDSEALGRLIRSRSRGTSSRFQQLAQETALIGQISGALLLRGEQESESRVHSATLDRIATDLEEEQRAAEWLRQAQTTTTTRLRQRRLTPQRRSRGHSLPTTTEEARSEMAALALEPRLMLLADDPAWKAYIEIPNLNPLISRFPQLEETLRNSRCKVTGAAGGRPMARGRVLSGSRRVELASWPLHGNVLVQFEQSRPELDALLKTDCLMRPGPVWLFDHQADGFAREVANKRVKPGASYVVVGSNLEPSAYEWLTPIQIRAADVQAALLSVPSVISQDFVLEAERLGLSVSTEVEVWPVGLAPASWDGTGRAEWRTTDTPRIGLRANVELERIALTITGAETATLSLPALEKGESCFVELPSMDVGTYQLSVMWSRSGVSHSELGALEIVVREPIPWSSAVDESSPLLVITDPHAPTLEELWDGDATFHIYAPLSRNVECRLSLFESRANSPFLESSLPPFTAPLVPNQWRQSMSDHLSQLSGGQTTLDRTSRCLLEFNADDLGSFRLECERLSSPVRWIAIDDRRQGFRLQVVDDRGSDAALDLQYFSFNAPEISQTLDPTTFFASRGAPAMGGLYLAQWGDERQAIVVPNQVHSLEDLGVDPVVRSEERSQRRVMEILHCIQNWQNAGLRGNFTALTHRNSVVNTLLSALVDQLGPPGWMKAERAFSLSGDSRSIEALEQSITHSERHGLYGPMRTVCKELDGKNRKLRDVCISWLAGRQFTRTPAPVGRHLLRTRQAARSAHSRWLAEFALRLASAPQSLEAWAHPDLGAGLDELFGQPKLLRAARFVVLVANRELSPEPIAPGVLYTGWDWE